MMVISLPHQASLVVKWMMTTKRTLIVKLFLFVFSVCGFVQARAQVYTENTLIIPDLEGSWQRLASVFENNPLGKLEGDKIILAPDTTIIFLGDLTDRDSHSRKILHTVNDVMANNPSVGLAANRDLNKWSLFPKRPVENVADWMKSLLKDKMGAPNAFEFRRTEIGGGSDQQVAESFQKDVLPGGAMRTFLDKTTLIHRIGDKLFVHGAINGTNFGRVPWDKNLFYENVNEWIKVMNAWYKKKLQELAQVQFDAEGRRLGQELLDYQKSQPGSKLNLESVVYGRLETDDAFGVNDPVLPPVEVRRWLMHNGIHYVFAGHTPQGNAASVMKTPEGIVFATLDTSYSQDGNSAYAIVQGSKVSIRKKMSLGYASGMLKANLSSGPSFIGYVTEDGFRIKGKIRGSYYLEKTHKSNFKIEHKVLTPTELIGMPLHLPGNRDVKVQCNNFFQDNLIQVTPTHIRENL